MDVFVCRVRFSVVVPHRVRTACDRGARAAMLLPLQRSVLCNACLPSSNAGGWREGSERSKRAGPINR